MAKTRRTNYLIDKPFQIGFILRYVVIIISTIIIAFLLTGFYFWFVSSIGKFKLDTAVTYIERGQQTFQNKKIFKYDKDNIKVYEDYDNNTKKKIYKCYQTYDVSTVKYQVDEIIPNIDESALEPDIGPITKTTTRFNIILFPLIWTGLSLIIIITLYSLFFSHRMAGPIYRIRVSLDRMLQGDMDFKVKVRKNDYFVNIVDRLEQLRQKFKDK